jgi:transposase
MLPHDFPPWEMVYRQSRRWLAAGVFDSLMGDLRELLRRAHDKKLNPTACILDSRTRQSTPKSGERAGFVGA